MNLNQAKLHCLCKSVVPERTCEARLGTLVGRGVSCKSPSSVQKDQDKGVMEGKEQERAFSSPRLRRVMINENLPQEQTEKNGLGARPALWC